MPMRMRYALYRAICATPRDMRVVYARRRLRVRRMMRYDLLMRVRMLRDIAAIVAGMRECRGERR